MKKCWLILLALTVVTAMFAYEVVAWQEDFEGDISGWTHYDGAESPNNWHVYDYGGAQGNVWWMGDPDLAQGSHIGGYYSRQYLVLDTPARTLTASNATLTFKMRHKVEDPGTHEGYDVWDSMNVRVSTNNGATWTVISGTPAYHGTSSYAFGVQHGEGPGIPAWGGSLLNWTNATFDLSAYVGQSVKVRFAFASDPAYDTTNDRSMFGWMVDDIAFGGYTNNGVDDGQMTITNMVPLGGDIWHLSTDPNAPSPTHVMKCQNAQGTYNPNMFNYLVSPLIPLPTGGDLRADFMLQGDFNDTGTFPNIDYHGWEISPDDGETWYAMSNPYGDPNGMNYVYSDAPDSWSSMVGSYSLDGYITDYAGQSIRLRWYLKSNETVDGTGYMIDDVIIYQDIYIEAPSNLTADVDGNDVILNWALGDYGGGDEGWLGYCADVLYSGIGTNSAADFDVAIKWDPSGEHGINPWVGMNVTKIRFIPALDPATNPGVTCQYSIRLWTGTAGNEMVYEQVVPSYNHSVWNEVVLTTPWTIPPGTSVWAGYRNNTTGGHPAGCDPGPAIDGYGNMIKFGGAWSTLLSQSSSLDYNWNIEMYVQDAAGREYLVGGPFADYGKQHRDASAFKVFRNSILIDERDGTAMTYTDPGVPGGLHSYYVTAMYGEHESAPSNTVSAFVMPANHSEVYNDDGTAEVGFNMNSSHLMAVKHTIAAQVKVKYAKVYVHTATSALVVRILDNDGPGGMPRTELANVLLPASSVVQGWNYVTFTNDVTITDGQFYVAITNVPNSNLIGLDTSTNGNTFTKAGDNADWTPLAGGELMARAIVEIITNNDDSTVPVLSTKLGGNYPNPFNPETTISYSLKDRQDVKIEIYNVRGQLVRTLINETQAAGDHKVIWTGVDNNNRPVSSGLYYYKMTAGKYSSSKKMILMK